MGVIPSVEVGAKSSRRENIFDEDIDFKDQRNSAKAKRELYSLFLQDKLILSKSASDLNEKIELLGSENKILREQLQHSKEELHLANKLANKHAHPVWKTAESDAKIEGVKTVIENGDEDEDEHKDDKENTKSKMSRPKEETDIKFSKGKTGDKLSRHKKEGHEESPLSNEKNSRGKSSRHKEEDDKSSHSSLEKNKKSKESTENRISRIAQKIKAAQKTLRKSRS